MTTHRKLGAAIALVTAFGAAIGVIAGFLNSTLGRRSRSHRNRDRNRSGAGSIFAMPTNTKLMDPTRKGWLEARS